MNQKSPAPEGAGCTVNGGTSDLRREHALWPQGSTGCCGSTRHGAQPCQARLAQLGLCSNRQFLANQRYCVRLDVQCPGLPLLGNFVPPVTSFRARRSGLGTTGPSGAWIAVAPLRTGPTCTTAGGPASCQPSSSSLTATGGFLSRGKIPPFLPPPF